MGEKRTKYANGEELKEIDKIHRRFPKFDLYEQNFKFVENFHPEIKYFMGEPSAQRGVG